ncbi:hypothetical protein TIFTF001_018822 [Ficus carica]|uniref:Uncharacterized protein n=1 Tax=Ficus carica TaxID=3494 RepID=A0AA88AD73_FICCA|nr:hypothetical protein TIFTF001_018822 [Ficus carica]
MIQHEAHAGTDVGQASAMPRHRRGSAKVNGLGQRGQDRAEGRGQADVQTLGVTRSGQTCVGHWWARNARKWGEWLHQWPRYLGGKGNETQARGP